VQRAQVARPDHVIELGHRRCERGGGAQVVACGEGVACVDADAHAALVVDEPDHVAQVLEARADYVARPRHVLEERHDGFRGFVRAVQHAGDPCDCLGAGGAACVAGVEVVQLDPEGFAAR
ncbi:hypothetical protein V496_10221, partial [Pseudogymnoascus sp. VKM F-4515 (FW-2607)]